MNAFIIELYINIDHDRAHICMTLYTMTLSACQLYLCILYIVQRHEIRVSLRVNCLA